MDGRTSPIWQTRADGTLARWRWPHSQTNSAREPRTPLGLQRFRRRIFMHSSDRGLPANEETLYRTDAKTIKAAWKMAAEQGVIPAASAEDISNVANAFRRSTARRLLDGPALVGASSLKDMLVTSRLTDEQQSAFARHYAANRADTDGLLERDRRRSCLWQPSPKTGALWSTGCRWMGSSAYLTVNNAPLMTKRSRCDRGERRLGSRATRPGGLPSR